MDFICECGNKQRKESPRGIITERDLERFGWRKINEKWMCPVCIDNRANLNNTDDIHDCSCAVCAEGMEKIVEWERKSMKEYGWYAHIVMNDPDCPYNYNIHTHGVPRSFDHPDLQICCPMDPRIAHGVLGNIIEQIKAGKKYETDKPIIDEVVLGGYPFLLTKARECDREVLRVIVSDKHKNIDRETMELSKQWEGTE